MQKENEIRTAEQIVQDTHDRVKDYLTGIEETSKSDVFGKKDLRLGYFGSERFCLPEIKSEIESGSDR